MKRIMPTIPVLLFSLVAATQSQAQCGLVTAGGVINGPIEAPVLTSAVVSKFGGTAMTTTLSQ